MNFEHHAETIATQIDQYVADGKRVFATSSFQTQSVPLLRIISKLQHTVPVYFVNTGFHFPETLSFRDELRERLDILVQTVRSDVPRIDQCSNGTFYFAIDTDYCCHINKVNPLEKVLTEHDVWISGLRRDQSGHRKNILQEERARGTTLRYHPMLDWTQEMIVDYIRAYRLPSHPLDSQGYRSIGCMPCTERFDPVEHADVRSSRWGGTKKTECGLHTELLEQ